MPNWMIIAAVFSILVSIGSLAFVVSKCGFSGLLYGNGAVIVAASGACD